MESHLDMILAAIADTQGVDLRGYHRPMLARRVASRMARLGEDDLAHYASRLRGDEVELRQLLDAIAINVSRFFRDALVFEQLAAVVLPELVARRERAGTRELRVWSAGCGCGEEAYSLAIILQRAVAERRDWTTLLFATDIDREALATAAMGRYPRERLEHVQLGVLDRHFLPADDGFAVSPALRATVRFSWDDLTSPSRLAPPDSVFGAFDLILCRNVMIYFAEPLQRAVLEKLSRALAGGGYLVLGEAESVVDGSGLQLTTIDARSRIFQRPTAGGER